MLRVIYIGLLTVSLMASAANAAVLNASGSVSVNRGAGFQPVSGSVEVNPGDRVLVGPSGNATIAYSSTCVTTVPVNQLAIVRAQPPCPSVGPEAPLNNTGLIVGGAVIAGGIAAAVIVANKGASP